MHGAKAHAETQVLTIARAAFNSPATSVIASQLLGGGIRAAGSQAPGLLHGSILNANHSADWIVISGDRGAAQQTRTSAGLHPGGSGAGFAGCGGHGNVAAEADDVVKI